LYDPSGFYGISDEKPVIVYRSSEPGSLGSFGSGPGTVNCMLFTAFDVPNVSNKICVSGFGTVLSYDTLSK
jgi:hypothetical protein